MVLIGCYSGDDEDKKDDNNDLIFWRRTVRDMVTIEIPIVEVPSIVHGIESFRET